MQFEDNLTYLQKAALKGEIAFALSTSSHDAELKYRVYLILKEVEDESLKPFIVSAVKESVTFDEEIIDRLYLETLSPKIPVWLWIEKTIADIKLSISLGDIGSSGSKISINKTNERKALANSCFIAFARKAIMISPTASEQLFDTIMEDTDLEFLHTSCYTLKSCCDEVREIKGEGEVPFDILNCCFDIRDMLSVKIETDALRVSSQKLHKCKKIQSREISQEELSQFISQKVSELFEGNVDSTYHPTKHKRNVIYSVQKVFTGSGISTTIRQCKTKEEATKFIKKIQEEYPELKDTCNFFIQKEITDEN